MVIEDRITDIFADPKTVLNRAAGILLLGYSAPVFLFVATAVALDTGSGSVMVKARPDERVNGCDAPLWRFRTACQGDGRETALGGLLRRTRIELLPQLVNVARGDITVLNALR